VLAIRKIFQKFGEGSAGSDAAIPGIIQMACEKMVNGLMLCYPRGASRLALLG
jgi:hypothetical protein